ncbi:hypothetical protein [Acetobacter senegalensis]|uniref:hypothetical protein n=1 Tax=Acetobacter senegalensis TaxID=446692 RepID=UPI001EDC5D0B|nr:hypothetical protein [Acetobacter senegalensis]MCG4256893.1 hypothetical protein [Acetobacter senegalensis]MCG4266969.1 hypothetical protein [Acetobacter senegalensis]
MGEAKFTPGPWAWFGSAGGAPDVYLATNHSGRRYVMSFRRWGLNGAQPCFQPEGRGMKKASDLLQFEVGNRSIVGIEAAKKDTSVYRFQIRGIAAPDAYLIAAAPELYEALDACLSLILSQELQDGFESQQGHMARAALAKARGETP